MFKKNAPLRMLGLALATLFLMSVTPAQAQMNVPETSSTEQAPQTTVKKKKAVKKSTKKAKKKKTSSKASKKKVAAKKKAAPVATAAATPIAAPVAAVEAAEVTPTVSTSEVTSTASVGTQQALLATVPASGSKGMGGKALPSPKATPTEVVRQFYNNLTETMKQGDSLGFSGRTQKLQASLERSFNMDEMMRTAAGPSWSTASPEQQKKMVAAFRNFSLSNYANRFARYDGEQFEVVGEKPGVREGEKVVETRLVSGTDSTDMNYVMRRDAKGQWKVIDVYVDGTISEMATRRSEFGSVLRQQGVDALLQLLNEKSSSLANS